jgi:hypothetical protein
LSPWFGRSGRFRQAPFSFHMRRPGCCFSANCDSCARVRDFAEVPCLFRRIIIVLLWMLGRGAMQNPCPAMPVRSISTPGRPRTAGTPSS